MKTSSFRKHYHVREGERVILSRHDPADTQGWTKAHAEARTLAHRERLLELHELLWADDSRALLIVLQGMDAAGKDGTIKNVMYGVNPQGCRVTAFRAPSDEERDHDFLWRVHRAVPRYGEIGVFNRSHYEDVLVPRVRRLVPPRVWRRRYEQINAFEDLLDDNRVTLIKFFLHISKSEQRERLEKRLRDRRKNWKFALDDLEARRHWADYQRAYEDALSRCATRRAPWFIVPADKKWYRDLVVSSIVVETLADMPLRWPKPKLDLSKIRLV